MDRHSTPFSMRSVERREIPCMMATTCPLVRVEDVGQGRVCHGSGAMNVFLDGPKLGQEGCAAPILGPGESKTYKVKLSFIDRI